MVPRAGDRDDDRDPTEPMKQMCISLDCSLVDFRQNKTFSHFCDSGSGDNNNGLGSIVNSICDCSEFNYADSSPKN